MNTHHALPPELSIYTAPELKALLLDYVRTAHPDEPLLVLDASAVKDIDGAGVQLLLALDNSLRLQDRHLVVAAAGPNVRQALQSLGADGLLDNKELAEAGQ